MLVMVAIISSIATHYQYFDVEKSIETKVGKIEYANLVTLNGVKYITKNDTVVLSLKGTDTNYLSNSLTTSNIVVKVGGNVVIPETKVLNSPTNVTNGVQYKLTLSGISGNGELSIEITENTLKDKSSNKNILTTFKSGIIVDNEKPIVNLTPNGGTGYTMPTSGNATIKTKLVAQDIDGSGLNVLQYSWSTSDTIEPTNWNNFTNESIISKTDCTVGNYYLWTKVIDKVGNRATNIKVSNVFRVNSNTDVTNQITLTPNTTGWTNQDITVTATYGSNLVSSKLLTCTGIVNTDYVVNGTESVVVKTNNKIITAVATDIAGNQVAKTLVISNIDKIAPNLETSVTNALYSDPTFSTGINGVTVYNNSSNGKVNITRTQIEGAPAPTSNYGLEIKTTGSASPGLGGFYFATKSAANKVFITKIIAKIPKGYTLNWGSNAIGTGSHDEWLTSQEGTGDWQEYILRITCGGSGTFSTTNFYYLNGQSATDISPVTWYVSYAQVIDEGSQMYLDPTFSTGINGITAYNNSKNGNVTITRTQINGAPFPTSNYGLEIKTTGTASPGLGGFYFGTQAAANKIFVTRIIAKIPKGYTINWASNSTGVWRREEWLTSQAGTGDWQEYIFKVVCGPDGTFSTTNYFYLTGTAATASNPVIWHVSYANVTDELGLGTYRNILSKGNDNDSGLAYYGISNSNTVEPTYKSCSSQKFSYNLSDNITTNANYYIWLKDRAGNRVISRVIPIKIEKQLVFDRTLLNSGSKYGSVTVATWGYPIGLVIQGRAANKPVDSQGIPFSLSTLLRWYKTIDVTDYNYLEYDVMKYKDHGSSSIFIGSTNIHHNLYTSLTTSWKHVKLDISRYKGLQTVSFVGGYVDTSGNADSTTYYSNIRMYR